MEEEQPGSSAEFNVLGSHLFNPAAVKCIRIPASTFPPSPSPRRKPYTIAKPSPATLLCHLPSPNSSVAHAHHISSHVACSTPSFPNRKLSGTVARGPSADPRPQQGLRSFSSRSHRKPPTCVVCAQGWRCRYGNAEVTCALSSFFFFFFFGMGGKKEVLAWRVKIAYLGH
jgi:hypothetical protein